MEEKSSYKKGEKHLEGKKEIKDPIDMMKAFIKEVKDLKNLGTELEPKYDIRKVLPFVQITWKETSKVPATVIGVLKRDVIVGGTKVTLKKALSDNCVILNVRTNRGLFSTKVICETEAYKPDANGTWGVNPLSFRKM